MKRGSFIEKKSVHLKEIMYRKLRSGDYALYADCSELIVVGEEIAKKVIGKRMIELTSSDNLMEVLEDSRFLEDEFSEKESPISEPKSVCFKAIQVILILLFFSSIAIIAFYIGEVLSMWNFAAIDVSAGLMYLLPVGLIFSLLTVMLHEIMHIIFSGRFENFQSAIKLSIKKSTAYVDLTHVWTWSLISRLLAVSAGVMLDTIILSLLLLFKGKFKVELFELLFMVMYIRIIWQFRFHRKTDGRYFIMMLLDNPFIDVDYKVDINTLSRNELWFWRGMLFVGYSIDLYIAFFWIIPMLFRIGAWIGGAM